MSQRESEDGLRAAASRLLAVIERYELLERIKREYILFDREYDHLESAVDRLNVAARGSES